MKHENSALVLLGQGNVQGVVQIRKSALERNPELLEQMREEARTLYNQVIIIEENLEDLGAVDLAKLRGWLRRMNPQEEANPWEEAARWAVSGMLDSLEFQEGCGSVVAHRPNPGGMMRSKEITSLSALIRELEEVGEEAWGEEVPVYGGGQAFRMSDTIDTREMLFERCEEELRKMGWT